MLGGWLGGGALNPMWAECVYGVPAWPGELLTQPEPFEIRELFGEQMRFEVDSTWSKRPS